MDENVERKISYLHSQGQHREANELAQSEHDAQHATKEIATDVARLSAELAGLRSDVHRLAAALVAVRDKSAADAAGTRTSLLDALPHWKKVLIDAIDHKLHDEIISLEREFNVALSLNARRAATTDEDSDIKRLGATVQSFQRQLSRNSDHVAGIETRLKKLERGD